MISVHVLTVNLKEAGAFTTRIEGNTFILKINSAQAVAKPVSASAMQTQRCFKHRLPTR